MIHTPGTPSVSRTSQQLPAKPWTPSSGLMFDSKRSSRGRQIPMRNYPEPNRDARDEQLLYDEDIFIPLVPTSTSASPKLNSSIISAHSQTPSNIKTVSDSKHVAETFEMFFDHHLQNIQSEADPEVSPYFSYCYSPPSPSPLASDVSRFTQTNSDLPPPVPKIIEEVLDEEFVEEKLDVVEDLTDDELDKISCYIVQESLDAAASNTDIEVRNDNVSYFHISNCIILSLQDLLDSDGDLALSDERRDQFPGQSPAPYRK